MLEESAAARVLTPCDAQCNAIDERASLSWRRHEVTPFTDLLFLFSRRIRAPVLHVPGLSGRFAMLNDQPFANLSATLQFAGEGLRVV
ncbi:hypothetical protein CU661_24970, partial [Pseudomonas syringae pv. actinidifoliorum]|nr:hypothetical protein [Pseudomonas syringae pv. actinidifoliorum]